MTKKLSQRRDRPADPVVVHEYAPDPRPEHDECRICGEEFEAVLHIPIGQDESEVLAPTPD
jgi:hypothetical protein